MIIPAQVLVLELGEAIIPDASQLPSGRFGANAAWWWIMLLGWNLNQIMKRLVLGGVWVTRRLKAIRFHLLCLPARMVERARQHLVRVGRGGRSLALLVQARRRIYDLETAART